MAVSNDEFMLLELFDRRWLPMLRCATDASSMSFIHSFIHSCTTTPVTNLAFDLIFFPMFPYDITALIP